MPVSPKSRPSPDPELLFCAVCQVSVAHAELRGGAARRTPKGRVFCPICAKSTPAERMERRRALEQEFADAAPIGLPPPLPKRRPASPAAPASRPVPASRSAPMPVVVPERTPGPHLEARVAELERAAFRMRTRLDRIDETLDEILRRLG